MAKKKTADAFVLEHDRVYTLPLDCIEPDPAQPRKHFDLVALTALATSIKHDGRPEHEITVRPNPDKPGYFFIVDGERRWRATRMAELPDIPARLSKQAEAAVAQRKPFELKLAQATVNELREPLNAMEWGELFQEMHDDGISDAQIQEHLEGRGIAGKGRAYISNLRRLMNLPDWAKQMIREGRLSGAHGKYLLQGAASELVMRDMEKALRRTGDMAIETVRELQEEMIELFGEHHLCLRNGYLRIDGMWQSREFDPTTDCAKKCDRRVHVGDASRPFCLDEACFTAKNGEAKKRKAAEQKKARETAKNAGPVSDDPEYHDGPTPVTVLDGNKVDVDSLDEGFHFFQFFSNFDWPECHACEHRHLAATSYDDETVTACFNPPCYVAKRDAQKARQKRNSEILESIEDFHVAWVSGCVADSPSLQKRLLNWVAVERPIPGLEARIALTHLREAHGLNSLKDFLYGDDALHGLTAPLAAVAVLMLYPEDLRALGEAMNLSQDDYRINHTYLETLDREKLIAIAQATNVPALLAEASDSKDEKELRALLLENTALIGCPADVREAWETFGVAEDDDDQEPASEEEQDDLPLEAEHEG